MKFNKDIQVGNLSIGTGHRPFIIGEMSGNHNQSLDRALELVDAAAKAGVHALKIQTYTADTMTIDHNEGEFFIRDPQSLWEGKSLYHLYQEAHTPWEWHKAIFDRCKKHGIIGFSTPFDASAVDFLEELQVPIYKIASFENIDLPLIERVAKTKKPIIISTGMANLAEIDEAVRTVYKAGGRNLILLKCTSAYPAEASESNLLTIPHMEKLFHVPVGLSDHTLGIGVAIASVALGAVAIEKHFTLSRSEGGVDSAFSIEPAELKMLVEETHRAWASLGEIHYGLSSDREQKSLQFRRTLYVVENIKKGETFTSKNIRAIRPGRGLLPKYKEVILGKVAREEIKRGTPVNWDLIL